jgi:hypothetical protein
MEAFRKKYKGVFPEGAGECLLLFSALALGYLIGHKRRRLL